tara:strand:+ start:228 stop:788 length:561 start_codon:yes stop_codon:yes gene_type:complete
MGRIRDRGNDGGDVYRWHTLERLVKENGWTAGAELGIHDGVNFKHLVNTCPNLSLIGVDLYEAQPDNNGPEKWTPGENGHPWSHNSYYQAMLDFCNKKPNAKIYKDYTTNVADIIPDGSLDFVFIDADHGYEGCLRDIKAWSPKVRKGGYIIGHDIHFPTVIQAVTEYFGENSWKVEDDFIWWVEA